MEFFKNINDIQVQGDWVICIKQRQPERMTVSVLFKNDSCGDAARKVVPPLIFSYKAVSEIDGKFFADLNSVIPETAKMFSSMEHYLKQREAAKKQSQMEKDKGEKQKKTGDEKKKKFDDAMKKVDELEKQNKFREAWVKVPEPSDFPEQAEMLRKRRSALSAKFSPDLFGTPVEEESTEEQNIAHDLFSDVADNEEVSDYTEEDWEDGSEQD